MGLFDSVKNLGNILAPETTQTKTESGQTSSEILVNSPALSNPNDARLAKLRAAMAAQASISESVNLPENPTPTPTPTPVSVEKIEDSVIATGDLGISVEIPSKNKAETATVVNETITHEAPLEIKEAIPKPETIEPSTTPEISNVKKEIEASASKIGRIEKESTVENQHIIASATGHELVTIFLSEINDLVKAGQLLQELTELKNSSTQKSEETIQEMKQFEESSVQIKSSIEALMMAHDDENLASNLQKAKDAVEEYDRNFSNALEKMKDDGRKETNELIVKINSKKAEIKKILGVIGGQENFDKIKKVIRDTENVSRNFFRKIAIEIGMTPEEADSASTEVFNSAINEFLRDSKTAVSEDLEGMKLLVSTGDIVRVFQRIVIKKGVELRDSKI